MKKALKYLFEYVILLLIGGGIYYCIELLWRGESHWTMVIVGGISFILIGLINYKYEYDMSLISQTVIAGLIITAVELLSGILLNLILGLDIWDYSNEPKNFLGQICLSQAYLWQWLSLVGIILDDVARWLLFGEQRPKYNIL